MIRRPAPAVLREERGVAIIEFALVVPVLLLLILGLSDLCYRCYAQAILDGAVQKAGRDATIEGAASQSSTIDASVISQVQQIARNATFVSTRSNYDTYTSVAPEPFVDSGQNGVYDGICNHGESYTDVNGNGLYDTDPGITGQGGASDVTKYTMTVTYPRLFPLGGMLGWSTSQIISASTILKNQPYATQTRTTAGSGSCS